MLLKNYTFKGFSTTNNSFEKLNENEFEIPMGKQPSSFGFQRKFDIHTGVDIYCQDRDIVLSLTDGIIVDKGTFTGKEVNSDWWNTTEYVAIQYLDKVIVYGELRVYSHLNIGDNVLKDEEIGVIVPVLKTKKYNPTTMLHLELYEANLYSKPVDWGLNTTKPIGLLSPLFLFIDNFNMRYPSKRVYEFLYAKYIEKEFKFEFLNYDYKNKDVLDLCGGAGYISSYMANKRANIDYCDLSTIMISDEVKYNSKINKIYGSISNLNFDKLYDYIFTKQAINYWLKEINIKKIVDILKPNGKFIFNTFDLKDKTYIEKEYEINKNIYKEISEVHNGKLFHFQYCNDIEHRTIFDVITKEEFLKILVPYFNVEIVENNSSFYYVCEKK